MRRIRPIGPIGRIGPICCRARSPAIHWTAAIPLASKLIADLLITITARRRSRFGSTIGTMSQRDIAHGFLH